MSKVAASVRQITRQNAFIIIKNWSNEIFLFLLDCSHIQVKEDTNRLLFFLLLRLHIIPLCKREIRKILARFCPVFTYTQFSKFKRQFKLLKVQIKKIILHAEFGKTESDIKHTLLIAINGLCVQLSNLIINDFKSVLKHGTGFYSEKLSTEISRKRAQRRAHHASNNPDGK